MEDLKAKVKEIKAKSLILLALQLPAWSVVFVEMEDVLIQMPLSDQKEISALLLDVEEGQDAKMENVYQPSIMTLLAQLCVAFKGPHV